MLKTVFSECNCISISSGSSRVDVCEGDSLFTQISSFFQNTDNYIKKYQGNKRSKDMVKLWLFKNDSLLIDLTLLDNDAGTLVYKGNVKMGQVILTYKSSVYTPIHQAFARRNYSIQKNTEEIDPVYKTLENNNICLCVDSAEWNRRVEQNHSSTTTYSYYCDTSLFVKHFLKSTSQNQYYLVEGKTAHGSGEYDNFIVKINDTGDNTITQYFKGYLQKLDKKTNSNITSKYRFYIDIGKYCDINGVFTDSIFSSANNKQSCLNKKLEKDGYVWAD